MLASIILILNSNPLIFNIIKINRHVNGYIISFIIELNIERFKSLVIPLNFIDMPKLSNIKGIVMFLNKVIVFNTILPI